MMHKEFQMSSMSELAFFLGLQVKQKEDGIFISQDKYVTETLKKFGFNDVKTASTPMETHKPLLKDADGEDINEHMYRSMIGSLMYLTSSRPDIVFVVCVCAKFQVNPKVSHLHAVKRIFRYLKGQPKLGLWYPKDSPFDLVAYTEHARADCGCLIPTELNYVAASSCCGQVLWIQNQVDYDFLNANPIKYALTVNPAIYTSCIEQLWATTKVKTINGEVWLQALVDGKKVLITETSVRRDLSWKKLKELNRVGKGFSRAVTPLFPTMMVQALEEMGEGSAMPTNPHHTLIIQLATSQPQKKQSMRKQRKDTEISQFSASSNDPLLSGKDRLKLEELMTLCTNLQNWVLDLEHTKTTQALEIESLKRRVNKLEKKKRSRTPKLKDYSRIEVTLLLKLKGVVEEVVSTAEVSALLLPNASTIGGITPSTPEGYGDAIVIPAILMENFELKHGLLNLVTSKQFYRFEKEDPHAHIRWFNKITSTIKYKDVPNSSIKLMLFSFSIEGAARIWLEKEPPRSILTWEDLVSKFINQFFPPSKTTNLRNEITNFQQNFEETFNSLNAAAGGNLLTKIPRDALTIIENKSKVLNSRNKSVVSKVSANTSSSTTTCLSEMAALTDAVNAMRRHVKTSSPETVKAISKSCVTYGGPHPYYEYLAADGNTDQDSY
ncbi:uncharacterized mitochondrial protein-like protein [Tanacetum coccineum]